VDVFHRAAKSQSHRVKPADNCLGRIPRQDQAQSQTTIRRRGKIRSSARVCGIPPWRKGRARMMARSHASPAIAGHWKNSTSSPVARRKDQGSAPAPMQSEMAAPRGQLGGSEQATTMFEIMMPLGPPSKSGARKSPRLRTKAKVAPASTPGMERGKITRQKVCPGVPPRSWEASTRLRGMCSRDA
jgi:hypothetical protein